MPKCKTKSGKTKSFPYTTAGRKAAKKCNAKKKGKKKGY